MENELICDANGDIITCPVAGWTITTAADIAGILAVRYATTPVELETEAYQQIQFVLTAAQCLEIAEALTRLGTFLQNPTKPGQVTN